MCWIKSILKRLGFLATIVAVFGVIASSDWVCRSSTVSAYQGQQPSTVPTYVRRGDQIPTYVVVRSYFEVLELCAGYGSESWNGALKPLGISPDSAASERVHAAVQAASISEAESIDLLAIKHLPRDQFMGRQLALVKKKVRALSRIYHDLCDDLADLNVSTEPLETLLETSVRPGISMSSTGDANDELFEVFEQYWKDVKGSSRNRRNGR